jgi:hypothetical protein
MAALGFWKWRPIAGIPTVAYLRRTVTEIKAINTSPRSPRTNTDSLSGVWISPCCEVVLGSDDRKKSKRTAN